MENFESSDQTDSTSARMLAKAATVAGDIGKLANALGVERDDIEKWLDGRELPPHEVFVRALNLLMQSRAIFRRRSGRN